MEYRNLGSSGTLVSTIALGTMNFGTEATSEEEAFAQLDAFIEAGGNLIDTADVYNGGGAEEPSAGGSPPAPATSPATPSSSPKPAPRPAMTPTRPARPAATWTGR
jgi:hypothetical protein